jgi:DNA-binding NarL/FixJ family response regulator
VEDHVAIQQMMRAAVELIAGYKVIGYAADLAAARELVRRERPDLIVLDLVLPSGSGLGLLAELRELCPRSRVVVFSGNLRPGTIRAALVSGAHGLVEKTATLDEFHQALRAVGSGQVYYSRYASEAVRKIVDRRRGEPPGIVRLTDREKAVLRAIGEGLSSKEISVRLGISWHTVVHHRTRLAKKTGVRGSARQARYAVQLGLLADSVEGAAEAV